MLYSGSVLTRTAAGGKLVTRHFRETHHSRENGNPLMNLPKIFLFQS